MKLKSLIILLLASMQAFGQTNVPISQLPPASTLTGSELLWISQSGHSVRTTTQGVANLAGASTAGYGVVISGGLIRIDTTKVASLYAAQHSTDTTGFGLATRKQLIDTAAALRSAIGTGGGGASYPTFAAPSGFSVTGSGTSAITLSAPGNASTQYINGAGGASLVSGLPVSTATQTALNLKANISSLATVGTTGAYSDLTGKPTIPAQFNPIAGTNLTLSGSYPNITFNASGGGASLPTQTGNAGKYLTTNGTTASWVSSNTVQALTDASTVVWDFTLGNTATVTLGGNRTLSVINTVNGDAGVLYVTQDATGGRTLALTGKKEDSLHLLTTAGSTDALAFQRVAADTFWYVSHFTAPANPSAGLIAEYLMEEASGTRVDDVGSYNLTPIGSISSATGLVGNAASLGLAKNFYNATLAPNSVSTTQPWTINMWIKVNSLPGAWGICGRTDVQKEFSVYSIGGDIHFGSNNGTGDYDLQASSSITTGAWYMLTFVFDGTQPHIYINGVLADGPETNPSFRDAIRYNASNRFYIGESNSSPSASINGLVDQVRVYNIALSGAAITARFNAGAGN